MRTEFFMPMVPPTVTAQQQRTRIVGGKPVRYDSPELAAAKMKLEAHLAKHRLPAPLHGPLMLVTKWCWPCEGTNHENGDWYIEKPDTHNVVKMPVDVMEKLGFFEDDKAIAFEVIQKFWATVPGIYVAIEELS